MTAITHIRLGKSDVLIRNNTIHYRGDLFVHRGRFVSPSGEAKLIDLTDEFSGLNVIPGLVDCQVNGAADVLFEDIVESAQFEKLDAALAKQGTTRWCGAFISSPVEKVERVLKVIETLGDRKGLVGFHFEGPWLNPDLRGCHPLERLSTSSSAHLEQIEKAKRLGHVLVTLAPEVIDDADRISLLNMPDVVLAVGHSSASPHVIDNKFGGRVRGLTHMFNCMPPLTSRQAGPLGLMARSLDCWGSIVCDGHHVCLESFQLIKRAAFKKRVMLVSDLMPIDLVVRGTPLFSDEGLIIEDESLRTSSGLLAGSATPLMSGVKMAVNKYSVPADEAICMASEYPAAFLSEFKKYGAIDIGKAADFVITDNQFNVFCVFRNGKRLL